MRKLIILIMTLSIVLLGCGTANNKVMGIVELNKTTKEDLKSLSLEEYTVEYWNAEMGIYEISYIWHYADYKFNNINGEIRIYFENKYDDTSAKFVNFSTEATSKNMEQLLAYLVQTYGEEYKEYEVDGEYITRWTENEMFIDFVLTTESTLELRWYYE